MHFLLAILLTVQAMPLTELEMLEEIQKRRSARNNLLDFSTYTMPSFNVGEHHKLICEKLEAVERGEINRLMIFAPPRHGKSELASKRFPAWFIGRHPNAQVICVSHTGRIAEDFGADVRDIVKDQYYRNLFPKTVVEENAQAAYRWRTTAGGIYISAGVDGNITGRGAHIAIIDDPVKGRNEAESSRVRETTWRFYVGDLYQRLMDNGAIVFMMTRWHEDDLAARALNTEDWEILNLPAIANEHTDNEEPLWPPKDEVANEADDEKNKMELRGWSLKKLRAKRAMMTRAGRIRDWQAQYQQNPTPEEGSYCKKSYYGERWEKDELPDPLHVYIASDYAASEPEEGQDPDWTEFGVFGLSHDHKLYVLDWWSGQATADVWALELIRLVRKWKPLTYFYEAGQIAKTINPIIDRIAKENGVYFSKEKRASTADKAVRGRAFQARSHMGMVIFPGHEQWSEEVIDQCVKFPGATHDDKFDVMSLMCLVMDEANSPIIIPDKPKERGTDYGGGRRQAKQTVNDCDPWTV